MKHNPTQREQMMAALSAAEHLVANSPEAPHGVDVQGHGVEVFFYRQPEDVAGFAAEFGLELSVREQLDGNERPIIEARGAVFGVDVRGWSLGVVGDMDRYRAVAADLPVSLPAAWSAQVAS